MIHDIYPLIGTSAGLPHEFGSARPPHLATATTEPAALNVSVVLPNIPPAGLGGLVPPVFGGGEVTAPDLNEPEHREAAENVRLVTEFLRLTASGFSGRNAASALGKSAAWFMGKDGMVARFERGGHAALAPARRAAGRKPDYDPDAMTRTEIIRALRALYLKSNRARGKGSVQEAARKYAKPCRFTTALLTAQKLMACPLELREYIVAREDRGLPLLPDWLSREVMVAEALVQNFRNGKEARLTYIHTPGTTRRFFDGQGEQQYYRALQCVEADDFTKNFICWVPWGVRGEYGPGLEEKCAEKYGVRVGRFQLLLVRDVATGFWLGYVHVTRPKSSYRVEDTLRVPRLVARQHGIPEKCRFERGAWENARMKDTLSQLGVELDTVYSPRSKPYIEGGGNMLWTKLAVTMPGQVGRFMGEHDFEHNLFMRCRAGSEDPRRHFPPLSTVLEAVAVALTEMNEKRVRSPQYGSWVPRARFESDIADKPPRKMSAEMDWLFSPMVREWTVKGMYAGGKVELFDGFSVPFLFGTEKLVEWHGAKVRAYFDPWEPRCNATLVLAENFRNGRAGDVIGQGQQADDVAAYARRAFCLADDHPEIGRRLAGKAAAAMRRDTAAILPEGRATGLELEMRNGVSGTDWARIEQVAAQPEPIAAAAVLEDEPPLSLPAPVPTIDVDDDLAELERANADLLS
jgi:hypothetical protein